MSKGTLIPCNKNSRYQIEKDAAEKMYFMRFVEEIPTPDGTRGREEERFQYFGLLDFKQYLKYKKHFNFIVEEILHDPTIVVAVQKPEIVEEPEEVTEKPKKQAYFGSEKWKADMEAKKQLKKQKQ